MPGPPLVIAHRGASGVRPENTLASFRHAIELGADMIELDCQLTRDGAAVVIHDETLDRTTNGRGPVAARTLAEIRELDAGSWFSPEFAGERVPTLEEAVRCLRGKASLNLEIKGGGGPGPLEVECLGILRSLRLFDDTVFSSFEPERMRGVRELSDAARIGILMDADLPWDQGFALARELGAEALHPERSLAAPAAIARAEGLGLAVRVWPVNRPADMERLLAMGVHGIFTDFPDRLVRLRSAAPPTPADA